MRAGEVMAKGGEVRARGEMRAREVSGEVRARGEGGRERGETGGRAAM